MPPRRQRPQPPIATHTTHIYHQSRAYDEVRRFCRPVFLALNPGLVELGPVDGRAPGASKDPVSPIRDSMALLFSHNKRLPNIRPEPSQYADPML
jgi:hypothetical protein